MTSDAFGNAKIKVPFFSPYIDEIDKKAVNVALKSTLLTDGPRLREFEAKFSQFTGTKHAIGVSNATAALHLSLKTLGVGSGDEVIVPDMTFVATANAVLLTGATPVIVDVDESDMNMSVTSLKKSITPKTKAIIAVHLFGNPVDIQSLRSALGSLNIPIIEDCAQATGAKYKNKKAGNLGDIACFSFYPTKILGAYGDGGFITTNNKNL